uniref:Tudor domain containing 7 a n=1 Tax=Sphaeramia orbicularis TaxID=375764 RepID=A0A673AML3_9TELE
VPYFFRMADCEKMLRAVLQSSKNGVSIRSLQSDYRSLCGESIPFKKLGFSTLEEYLQSIPSVVHLEHRMGELRCFAVVCKATAHIAELVARQKSSKKSRQFQAVNGMMRFKPSTRTPLRQPSVSGVSNWLSNRSRSHGGYRGFSTSGDYRQFDQKLRSITPVEHRSPPSQLASASYDLDLVQSRLIEVLEKHSSGLWMSKLPMVFSKMFGQQLHPQALIDLEKWTHICSVISILTFQITVEQLHITNQSDRLIYPPLPSALKAPSPAASSLQPGPDVLPHLKVTISPCAASKSSAVSVSDDVRQGVKDLLCKLSYGLWAHALPKLFLDTYKIPFPEHILNDLSLLHDICTVEYPIPHDKKKAILYKSDRTDREDSDSCENQQCRSCPFPSGLEVEGPVVPPPLVFPSEQYPSVLITDAKSCNAVTVRYVGKNHSNAQEAMEDAMGTFYSQSSTHLPLSDPVVGRLVAVRGEDEEEVARGQVMEFMTPSKVKVYYVDYGFSVETSVTNLLELHQDFISLPLQATNVQLAGLEAFSSHPQVLSVLDTLAIGKILLMETLDPCQQNEMPVVVLYDTSQDEDLNINSICLKALQDERMNSPLTVNVTYEDVCITNVCSDGIIYCQVPSRGASRLTKLLEEIEAFFISKMTSESLVSRPFSGKFCLARYKGKWSRVEITDIHDNRVIEVLFIDFGVPATLEVTELREIPPLFRKVFAIIPPQATQCRLADLSIPKEGWSPETVQWVKEAVLGSKASKMKVMKVDEHKGNRLVYIYLFTGIDSQELEDCLNHQLAQSDHWQKLTKNNTVTSVDIGLRNIEELTLSSPGFNPVIKSMPQADQGTEESSQPLQMPPSLELPQPGQCVDVFVPVAYHPGYFVLQPWQGFHKLVVLMGEMVLYYNQASTMAIPAEIKKGEVYAAKIDKNWYRVVVKGILSSGLVSVYELDHGKHEVVHSAAFRPLIQEFRYFPFQAIAAQLAGLPQHQWSEDASKVFRNHVEKRALVAQVDHVHEGSEVKGEFWKCKLTVYLVDTSMEDRDVWIHTIMEDLGGESFSAA